VAGDITLCFTKPGKRHKGYNTTQKEFSGGGGGGVLPGINT